MPGNLPCARPGAPGRRGRRPQPVRRLSPPAPSARQPSAGRQPRAAPRPAAALPPDPGADPQKYPGGSGLGGVSGALYPSLPRSPNPSKENLRHTERRSPAPGDSGRASAPRTLAGALPQPSTTRPRCPPLLALPAPRPSPTGTMGHRAGDNRHDGASSRAGHSPEPGTGPPVCTIKAAGRRNLAFHGDLLTYDAALRDRCHFLHDGRDQRGHPPSPAAAWRPGSDGPWVTSAGPPG